MVKFHAAKPAIGDLKQIRRVNHNRIGGKRIKRRVITGNHGALCTQPFVDAGKARRRAQKCRRRHSREDNRRHGGNTDVNRLSNKACHRADDPGGDEHSRNCAGVNFISGVALLGNFDKVRRQFYRLAVTNIRVAEQQPAPDFKRHFLVFDFPDAVETVIVLRQQMEIGDICLLLIGATGIIHSKTQKPNRAVKRHFQRLLRKGKRNAGL